MSDKSAIEWTEATWNPLRARFTDPITGEVRIGWHCEHASGGCINCYAAQINKGFFQLGTKQPYIRAARERVEIFLDEQVLQQPLRWKKPRMIFVCSMTDLFGAWHTDEMIDRIFAVMAMCRQHTFQVLTKRAERMKEYFAAPDRINQINAAIWSRLGTPRGSKIKHGGNWRVALPLPSVWLGVSVEDQKNANERIPWLLKTPAAVRWVSYEPALGPVNFRDWLPAHMGPRSDHFAEGTNGPAIDLIICGGESGPGARPMHPDWARSARDQCVAAGAKYFFKQWGAWGPTADLGFGDSPHAETHVFQTGITETYGGPVPLGIEMRRVGKKVAGRLLDGRTWDEMPEAAA